MSNNNVAPRSWSDYYKAIANRPPRETLLTALTNFERDLSKAESKIAVDLGCGEGRDTVELLRRGWNVIAIDAEEEAITRLLQRSDINTKLLQTHVAQFENIRLPESVNLINASFSLPFCEPKSFADLWNKIVCSLAHGGRFSGQLFGDTRSVMPPAYRDSWAADSTINHHTLSDVESLLQLFEIESLKEEASDGKTALGKEKHWHIFHIVARKK
ncbi:MAG: class I SAM-dependent methyltransferase [Rivularia sp. (in: cyanobacteria)]